MKRQHNYFILDRRQATFWQALFFIIKIPFSLPSWVVSFLLARSLTNITLNPTQVKKQRPIHLLYLSDDKEENGTVIVNLLPNEPRKALHDYLLKFNSAVFRLPFLSGIKKRQLSYDNPKDKAHIDNIIHSIHLLTQGKSNAPKCEGKTFNLNNIHFKGLECLDNKLRAYFLNELYKEHGDDVFKPHTTDLDFFTLETSEGAVLDSVAVTAANEKNKPIAERKFVIACMARDQNYINWVKDFKYSADQIGCTVIGFNYRGVDYSKGMVWTQENMINDTLAQVERLLALGAKPENIGLEGMCLGGAVATLAAARLHEQNLKVKLYNERSFRSLSRFITGFIIPDANCSLWNPVNWLRYITVGFVYIIIAPLVWLAGWQMDAESAWDKIPQTDKDYSVIRNPMDPNPEAPKDDGVVEGSWASIASLMDEKRQNVIERKKQGKKLTPEEKLLLADIPKNHHFKVAPEVDLHGKAPHHLARRHLMQTDSDAPSQHMHQHMIATFKHKFGLSPALQLQPVKIATSSLPSSDDTTACKRPLFIANSGGAGHISAIMGIIDSTKEETTTPLYITQHQAQLYKNRPTTILNLAVRAGIYIMSVRGIGWLVSGFARLLGYPRLPNSATFWQEMAKLEKAELAHNVSEENTKPIGRERPYVDMLLDIYPIGYEAVSIMNSLHRADRTSDITLLTKLKAQSEATHYQVAFDSVLSMLINAAERGEPYSEIVSSQPLSLAALCDAVTHYNQCYLRKKNRVLETPLPALAIHQYMTDLPTIGCDHFLDTLADLTPEQRQQMHIYAINLTPDILLSYLDGGHDFKGVHSLSPNENPMVRSGFKEQALSQYLDTNQAVKLKVKTYPEHPNNRAQPTEIEIPARAKVATIKLISDTDEVDIAAGEKVGTVMLGSLASDATVAYVKQFLESGYDKIFVFGGLNDNIFHPIEQMINAYPQSERQAIRARIVRLGNQSDAEMGPIMTRSNCVVIRGGGLSTMEQMALPSNPNKTVLLHHNDCNNGVLTSGLSWEDGNVDSLIEHLEKQGSYARKTSPALIREELARAEYFHDRRAQNSTLHSTPTSIDEVEDAVPLVRPIPTNDHPLQQAQRLSNTTTLVNRSSNASLFFQPIAMRSGQNLSEKSSELGFGGTQNSRRAIAAN